MKCLTPTCTRKAVSRGLCQKCYFSAYLKIKQGRYTWEQIEKAGLCRPSTHESRSAFSTECARRIPDLPGQTKMFDGENDVPNS